MAKGERAQGKGEQTRDRILDAAEVLFANLSFAAARLEDVAQAVGIRRASIVYYFKNKQELYAAMESRIFAALEDECQRELQGKSGALERIEAVVDAWLRFMVARPSAARLILRNCADVYPGGNNPVQFSQSALNTWEQAISDGVRDGELKDIPAMQLMQIVGGGILQYASTSQLLGSGRHYDPRADDNMDSFRALLHTTIRALLLAGDK